MASFKTRARAIDMLGRQQIAGIPSAISELFKNAHDAYADHVEVDYYRSDRLFVLRDDGLGMTYEDFVSRWLTIGTESKLGSQTGIPLPPKALEKPVRPVLGEKGIGRLAIAAIGPQVFIITRAKRDNNLHDTVAAYIHWGIFEMPGIDLDVIDIPVRKFSNGSLPNANAVAEMVQSFSQNLTKLPYISPEAERSFRRDFAAMQIDAAEIDGYLPEMSLTGEGHGTHFIIIPAYDLLEADIDSSTAERASSLEKALLGFTNRMTPDHAPPVIATAFRDHKHDDFSEDLIADRSFFTPSEFKSADHHFQGRFDEYGQFEGSVAVYQKAPQLYRIAWNGNKGKRTQCGPFKINMAYIQGKPYNTGMAPEEFNQLLNKTNRLGGLYIYKSGIRILPYGDTDYDWLEIEKRRTLRASTAHFSHRQMLGVIEIDLINNHELTEKAGREGFRENRAYREFREILKNMLARFAADFFVEEGVYSDTYQRQKAELERQAEARKKRAKLVSEKRKRFEAELNSFFEAYQHNLPTIEVNTFTGVIKRDLANAVSIEDERQAALLVLSIEASARQQLRLLEEKYRLIKPKGIGLSRKLQQSFADYENCYQELQNSVFTVARNLVEGEVTQVAEKAKLQLDRRVRIERALNDLTDQLKSMTVAERKETFGALDKVENEVRGAVKDSIAQINDEVQKVLTDFNKIDFAELEEVVVVNLRDDLENRLLSIKEQKQEFLRTIRAQLEAINLKDDISQFEQMEALEQQVVAMEERADMDLQLTQLGMAIEVINHEFDSSIRVIRDNLRRLKNWADVNTNLDSVYQGLRTSFDHLDGYLALFTPLHRRLHRQEVPIIGSEISAYLQNLFQQRFERHNITLITKTAFNKKRITGYPSSFYPVFVNLTDNAVYWLKESKLPRVIELDADQDSFMISNNGPSILESRKEVIFETGISFKPGGRGLGLAISREVLDKTGYTLTLKNKPKESMSVTFQISTKK